MAFTFNKSPSGNVEVFEEGKRIATATQESATQQYGYNAPVAPPVALQAMQTPKAISLPKKEPFVLSSEQGLDIDTKNRNALLGIQKGVEEAQRVMRIAQQQKAADIKAGEPLTFEQGTAKPQLTPTGSPVTVAMANQINQASQQGVIDDQRLADLKKKEIEAMSVIQQAQAAADAGDPIGLNTYTKLYQEQKKEFEDSMAQYLKDVEGLRAERVRLSIPGQREIEVKRQLNEIRAGQKKFELELEENKMSEFEGSGTLRFAQGRVQEKELRASFKRREMVLKEQNLLLELGLENENRKFALMSIDEQLESFREDFSLREKINESLFDMENDIIEKASGLNRESQKDLITFMNILEDVNPDELAPATTTKLNRLAQVAGIPFDLIKDSLKVGYQRSVFEKAIKIEGLERAGRVEERAERSLALSEEREERLRKPIAIKEGVSTIAQTIVANPQLFDQLTPSVKTSLIPQLQTLGFKFPRKLSGEQEKSQVNAQSGLLAISTLEDELYDPDGTINRSKLTFAVSGLGKLAYARREAIDVLTRIRTGAALNESEQKFYAKQAPRSIDDEKTIKSKLTQLKALYAGIAGTSLTLQSPEGRVFVYEDMFRPESRTEVRKAISAGYKIIDY